MRRGRAKPAKSTLKGTSQRFLNGDGRRGHAEKVSNKGVKRGGGKFLREQDKR